MQASVIAVLCAFACNPEKYDIKFCGLNSDKCGAKEETQINGKGLMNKT